MAGGHDWLHAAEQFNALNPSGTDLNLGILDISARTLSASGGVLGGFSISVPLIGSTAADNFVFLNNTGNNLTVKAISVIVNIPTVSAPDALLDVLNIGATNNAPSVGLALLESPFNLDTATVNAMTNLTLTATLAFRVIVPNGKISFDYTNTVTGLVGCVTILF